MDFKWTDYVNTRKEQWLEEFKAVSGAINCNFTPTSRPSDFFLAIFSEDLVSQIASWTNKRASERIDNAKRRQQKKLLWKEITTEEMKG